MTDGLTGLLNRIHIQEYIHSEVERFGRYNLAASLIFLDIDHFKEINDTHGHNTGDKVLQKFSNILQENIRNTDFAGRWGGEEFILLLPNTDVVQARIFAEKLRKKIEDSDTDDIITITASLGVSQIEIGESWETWVKRTDAAMYRAKSNGRNRVETDYGNTE